MTLAELEERLQRMLVPVIEETPRGGLLPPHRRTVGQKLASNAQAQIESLLADLERERICGASA